MSTSEIKRLIELKVFEQSNIAEADFINRYTDWVKSMNSRTEGSEGSLSGYGRAAAYKFVKGELPQKLKGAQLASISYYLCHQSETDFDPNKKVTDIDTRACPVTQEFLQDVQKIRAESAPSSQSTATLDPASKRFIYALSSNAIRNEADNPDSVIGIFWTNTNGAINGKALLAFDGGQRVTRHGDWESVRGGLHVSLDGGLMYEFTLSRADMSGRRGYIGLLPDIGARPCRGTTCFSGSFVDLNIQDRALERGAAYCELLEAGDDIQPDDMKQFAAALVATVQS